MHGFKVKHFRIRYPPNMTHFMPACKRCYMAKKLAGLAVKVLFFNL